MDQRTLTERCALLEQQISELENKWGYSEERLDAWGDLMLDLLNTLIDMLRSLEKVVKENQTDWRMDVPW
jgi:hypothetical protein